MYAIQFRTIPALPPAEAPVITAQETASALFEASERILMAPTVERQLEAIEANTALWLGLSTAAREGLVDLPQHLFRRLHRVAETVARRTLTRHFEGDGTLVMRLIRLNDMTCRAIAPPTRRGGRRTAPPPGLH